MDSAANWVEVQEGVEVNLVAHPYGGTDEQFGLCRSSARREKEVATVRSLDVVLPVKETQSQQTRELRLRVVARPDRMVAELLVRLGLDLPSVPRIVQNVVEKNGWWTSESPAIPHF